MRYADDSDNSVYPLTDADADTPGFQVDLDEGENLVTVHVYSRRDLSGLYALRVTRAATGGVTPQPNTPATGAPTTSGVAQVGQTLTADTSGIADANGLSGADFAYQWIADESEIPGATGPTYTPPPADVGKTIKARVRLADDAGHAESLTSAATTAVPAPPPVFSTAVLNQNWTVGQQVNLQLPTAEHGMYYQVDRLPPGLNFNEANRTISGAPQLPTTHEWYGDTGTAADGVLRLQRRL